MRVDARGLTFDVETGGPGDGPAVLLLHGFPQHLGEWELVAPRLHAAGLRTIAMNQRGYSAGARPGDVQAYKMSECVADALAVLDELSVPRAHIVGHDWGSAVAWNIAGRHPERTLTLTALSVPHPVAFAEAIAGVGDQRERSSYMQFFRQEGKAEDVLLEDGGRRIRAMFHGCPEERIDRYVEPMLDRARLTGGLNWYRATRRADLAGLGPVSVPTTFLWSDEDWAIGREAAEKCAAYVTGDYRFVELTGVSHWIPDAAPDVVAAEIIRRREPR